MSPLYVHTLTLEALRLFDVQAEFFCEPKPACHLAIDGHESKACIYSSVGDIIDGVRQEQPVKCLRHGSCRPQSRADMLVAGFPCAPFSTQRPGRLWQHHASTSVLWDVLKCIRLLQPQSGCLENVCGLLIRARVDGNILSPLEVILQELAAIGYLTEVFQLELQSFHAVDRKRSGANLWSIQLECASSHRKWKGVKPFVGCLFRQLGSPPIARWLPRAPEALHHVREVLLLPSGVRRSLESEFPVRVSGETVVIVELIE
eukprot:6490235-Amphidinium_carterae.1